MCCKPCFKPLILYLVLSLEFFFCLTCVFPNVVFGNLFYVLKCMFSFVLFKLLSAKFTSE